MKRTLAVVHLFAIAGIAAMATTAGHAATVQLDISNALTYDAVGTQTEVTANIVSPGDLLKDILGDHNVRFSSAYTNQGSVSSGTALPDDGVIGQFKIPTNYDNGTGMAAVANSIFLSANNSTSSSTILLPAAQQQKYSDINFLFVARRGADSTYQSRIEVTYTDSSTATLFDTGLVATSGAGGTFGSAEVGGQGGFVNTSDTDTSVALALAMDRILGTAGSPGSNLVRSGTAALWQFTDPFMLDESKTLESITLTTVSAGVNRTNQAWFFAATATEVLPPIPEPSAIVLVAIGGLALIGRARRRRTVAA